MNRFGMEDLTHLDFPDDGRDRYFSRTPLQTQAFLHYWDKGMRVPADLAALLLEEGIDVEGLESKYL